VRTPPPTGPHLLVVDDDPSVLEALEAALNHGYLVHGAMTGAQACAILRRQPIHGILLDVVLGSEHGLDLVAQFRALSPAPILVLTGFGSEAVAAQAVRAKVDDYLTKPMGLPALQATLARHIPLPCGSHDLAARARRALDAYPPKPFQLGPFARALGVSPMHLRRCFRAVYGTTPPRYLLRLRLERAARHLGTSSLAVAEVAWEVGLPTVPWFIKCFKRRFGVTPAAYRPGRAAPGEPEQTGGSNRTTL